MRCARSQDPRRGAVDLLVASGRRGVRFGAHRRLPAAHRLDRGALALRSSCERREERLVIAFVARRALQAIPVLLGVTFVAFLLTYRLPGDPARALAGESYREEDLVRIRTELGLDRPAAVQY